MNMSTTTRLQHPAPGARRRASLALGAALALGGIALSVGQRTTSTAPPAVAPVAAHATVERTSQQHTSYASTGDWQLELAIDRCLALIDQAAAAGTSADCTTGIRSAGASNALHLDVLVQIYDACIQVSPIVKC